MKFKSWILFGLLLLALKGNAQVIKGAGVIYFDSMPNVNAALSGSELAYSIKMKKVFRWNRQNSTWVEISSDTTSLSNRINTKLNISDTTAMLSPYLKKADTTSLSNRINTKLNISDTSVFARDWELPLKLNISDTTAMLSTYLKKADTTSLSNRINLKRDTADVIPILKGGTGATTAAAARTNLLPTQPGNQNKYLRTNGSDVFWDNVSGGSGTVTGTGAANKVAFWTDATTLSNNNNFHWDNTNGRLGIGTSTTDSTLTVAGGISVVNGINVRNGQSSFSFLPTSPWPNERSVLGITHTATSTDNSAGGIVGLALTAQTPNTSFAYGGLNGINAMRIRGFHAASTNLAVLNGVNFTVRNIGSGTVDQAVGGNFVMGNAVSGTSTGAGTIVTGTGGSYSLENSSSGTINTLRGINVQCTNSGTSNSIQTFYGLHLTALSE